MSAHQEYKDGTSRPSKIDYSSSDEYYRKKVEEEQEQERREQADRDFDRKDKRSRWLR